MLNRNDKDLTNNSGLKKTMLLNEVSVTKPFWSLNKSLLLGFWQMSVVHKNNCVALYALKIIFR